MNKTVTLRLSQQNLDHLQDIKNHYSTHPEEKTLTETIRFCIEQVWDTTPKGQSFIEKLWPLEQKNL